MAGRRIVIPSVMPALDINGDPVAGAKLYFYTNGTTTLASVYTSEALSTAHPNPLTADAAGQFAAIFADEDSVFSFAITDSSGAPINGIRNQDGIRPNRNFLDGVTAPVSEAMADVLVEETLALARSTFGFPSIKTNLTSGNIVYGSLGASMADTAAGTKNGDINTGFGLNVLQNATSAYACAAFGYGALNAATTGHSNTGLGYQAGLGITTGIMNTLVGVDAAYQSTALNYCVVVGHHCLNSANFAGEGAIIIGQQTARSLTSGNYINAIGRNAMANSPATGSADCEVIGGAAAIAASVNASTVIGKDSVAVSGAISNSVIVGKSAQYGGGTIGQNAIIGVETFFRATGGGGNNNTSLGYQTGYSVAGTDNVFLGYRAGYQGSNTSVTGSVCIGPLAGFNDLASGELVIANTNGAANVLIRGNFTTGDVTIRNDLNVGGDIIKIATAKTPASATATGTAGQICWDTSYLYVCTATDTWKRVALTTW